MKTLLTKALAILTVAAAALLVVPAVAPAQTSGSVTLEFAGLEPLGDAAVYEGWLIVDGEPYSTGTFNIDADGAIAPIATANVPDAELASTFVLTIEPVPDPDPAPAATHVLAGDIVDGRATLSIDHPAALGTDFADAAGDFIVATPTTSSAEDDLSGVWFLDPTGADGPVASLDLPTLPDGWAYEGWVVLDGVPVSTGRLVDAAAPDDFNGFSGPDAAPGYPGEDFIVNAPAGLTFPTDVTGAPVVISVEPAPDDGPAPFALKPLVGEVPAEVEVGALNTLGAGPVAISGTATIVAGPVELAMTGAETWLIAVAAIGLVAAGAMVLRFARQI